MAENGPCLNTDEDHLRWKADNDHAWDGMAEQRAYLQAALRLLDEARADRAQLRAELALTATHLASARAEAARVSAFMETVRTARNTWQRRAEAAEDAVGRVEALTRPPGSGHDLGAQVGPGAALWSVYDASTQVALGLVRVALTGPPGEPAAVHAPAGEPSPAAVRDFGPAWGPPVAEVDAWRALGACMICGEVDDHGGQPHSEATGDGRTRAEPSPAAGERHEYVPPAGLFAGCSHGATMRDRCGQSADHPVHQPAQNPDTPSPAADWQREEIEHQTARAEAAESALGLILSVGFHDYAEPATDSGGCGRRFDHLPKAIPCGAPREHPVHRPAAGGTPTVADTDGRGVPPTHPWREDEVFPGACAETLDSGEPCPYKRTLHPTPPAQQPAGHRPDCLLSAIPVEFASCLCGIGQQPAATSLYCPDCGAGGTNCVC